MVNWTRKEDIKDCLDNITRHAFLAWFPMHYLCACVCACVRYLGLGVEAHRKSGAPCVALP